jgi:hypothetical protein
MLARHRRHGALVEDILATKKAMEEAQRAQHQPAAAAAPKEGTGIRLQMRRLGAGGAAPAAAAATPASVAGAAAAVAGVVSKPALSAADIPRLRDGIQALAAAVAPLGRSLDFAADDAEAMQRELEQWRVETAQARRRRVEEASQADDEVRARRAKLAEVEAQVAEQRQRVAAARAQVLRNEAVIGNLLKMVTASAR